MRYRILISDDEVDIVEMLTGFFRSKGYEVFSAYNGNPQISRITTRYNLIRYKYAEA